MSYAGYYINLDRSLDRCAAMDAQLARFGLAERYRRFAAVDGNLLDLTNSRLTPSELGCFASHYRVLQQNLDSATHLHIIEDDVVLASCTAPIVEQLVASAMMNENDLLFTEMALPVGFRFYCDVRTRYDRYMQSAGKGTRVANQFSLLPYLSGATSYLVNRRSIRLICDILERELELGARNPIDLLIQRKVAEGKLRAKCLFPFITSFLPGKFASTVRNTRDQLSDLARDLIRHSFFVECDRTATLALAEQRLASLDADFHGRLLGRVLGFMTSEDYQPP